MKIHEFKPGVYTIREKFVEKDGSLGVNYLYEFYVGTWENLCKAVARCRKQYDPTVYSDVVIEPIFVEARPDDYADDYTTD